MTLTKAPAKATDGHHISVRVYYEDTDAAGIVYYANYLRYAERGRTELLRSLGFERTDLAQGVAFAVRHCTADYVAPARLDDFLDVATRLVHLRGASLEVEQTIRRQEKVLVRLTVRMACIDADGNVARMPAELRDALKGFESRAPSKMRRSA